MEITIGSSDDGLFSIQFILNVRIVEVCVMDYLSLRWMDSSSKPQKSDDDYSFAVNETQKNGYHQIG